MKYISKPLLIALFFCFFVPNNLRANTKRSAFFKSLLVPGWGELSSGSKTGYFFLASELSLWFTRFYYLDQSDESRNKAYHHALAFAEIDPQNLDDDMMYAMSRYQTSGFGTGGYNEMVVAQANNLHADDFAAKQEYIKNHIYDGSKSWNWENNKERLQYQQYLFDETDYEDLAKTMFGAIVVNHLLSGINAVRATNKVNRVKADITINSDQQPIFRLRYNF